MENISHETTFNRFETLPILSRYPTVKARFYDAEAFTAKCSDIAVYETEVLQDYYFLVEALRDSKVFTVPYFTIVDIFPAIEDGFVEYESSLGS